MGSSEALIEKEEDTTLASSGMEGGLIDAQVATAKKYPRVLKEVLDEALTMATLDQHTAETMFYTLKRRDKDGRDVFIRGPSIRLAEIFSSAWGNLRIEARISREEQKFIYAEATAVDLQKNTGARIEVPRRIVTASGRRYGVDMIGVTSAAAVSIAYRNALFRVVPRVYVEKVQRAAENVMFGGSKSLAEVFDAALGFFASEGVTEAQVYAVLGVAGREDLRRQHALDLVGFANAIRDKQMLVTEFIELGEPEGTQDEKAKSLNESLGAAATPRPPEATSVTQEAETPADPTQAQAEAEDAREGPSEARATGDVVVGLDEGLAMLEAATSVEEAMSLTLREDAPDDEWAMLEAYRRRCVNKLEDRPAYDGLTEAEKTACRQALHRIK